MGFSIKRKLAIILGLLGIVVIAKQFPHFMVQTVEAKIVHRQMDVDRDEHEDGSVEVRHVDRTITYRFRDHQGVEHERSEYLAHWAWEKYRGAETIQVDYIPAELGGEAKKHKHYAFFTLGVALILIALLLWFRREDPEKPSHE